MTKIVRITGPRRTPVTEHVQGAPQVASPIGEIAFGISLIYLGSLASKSLRQRK